MDIEQLLETLKTPKGGYTKPTLKRLGVSWPPQKGWKERLIANHKAGLSFNGKKLKKKQRKERKLNTSKGRKINYKYFANSPGFLSSYEWNEARYKALKKNNGKCELCNRGKAEGAILNVDHIKCRKYNPDLALNINNLQVLCSACNKGKGNWDNTDWRAKEESSDNLISATEEDDYWKRNL